MSRRLKERTAIATRLATVPGTVLFFGNEGGYPTVTLFSQDDPARVAAVSINENGKFTRIVGADGFEVPIQEVTETSLGRLLTIINNTH